MPIPRRRFVELTAARMLSPTVRSLTFRFTDGLPLVFTAGQYVDLFVPTQSGMVYKRPYSIASPPSAGEIEIAVTRVEGGPTSTALHALAPGATLEALAPKGVFTMRHAPDEAALFVATGTGLAPFRSMLATDLARADAHGARALLFGCRAEGDILWEEELRAWTRDHPRFRLEVTLSRGSLAWAGRRGYVQRHLAELAASMGHVYVCGLSKMTDEVVAMLEKEIGVPRSHVHHEPYD